MSKPVAREVYSGSPFSFGNQTGTFPTPELTPPTSVVEEAPIETQEEVPEVQPDPRGYTDIDLETDYMDDSYAEEVDESEEVPEDNQEESAVEIDQKEAVSSLFEAFTSLGLIKDETEVPKGETVADFLSNYEKHKAAKLEELVREELANTYSKEKLDYIDFLMSGGDPQAISAYHQVANLPIEDDAEHRDNRKALILAMHKDRGLNDKKALTLYNTAYDEGEDMEEAKEAKAYFQRKRDDQFRAIQEAEKRKVEEKNAEIERTAAALRETLKSRKVEGVELTEAEAKELETYMFNRNVVTDIEDPETGQTFKGKVSQYYIEYENFMKSPGALIKLAKFIKNNGRVDNQAERIEEEINQKLIIKLNGFNKGKGNQPKKKNAFLT